MEMALDEAQLSFNDNEVPVGAIIVKDNEVIGSGHNQVKFYRLEGNVSTENNGGFIQSRVNLNIKTKDYNGIRIKVRGNNNEYFIHVRGPRMLPWNYYYSSFFASNDWTIIELPLEEFKYNRKPDLGIDARSIRSIGIVAYGKDFQAELDLAQIELY